MKYTIFILVAAVIYGSCSFKGNTVSNKNSQNKGNNALIYGVLLHNHTKEPLAKSIVKLNDGQFSSKTKKDGRFEFFVPKGKYKISAFAIGQEEIETKKYKLKEGDSLYLEILMKEKKELMH